MRCGKFSVSPSFRVSYLTMWLGLLIVVVLVPLIDCCPFFVHGCPSSSLLLLLCFVVVHFAFCIFNVLVIVVVVVFYVVFSTVNHVM